MKIRLLTEQDCSSWKSIRLEALHDAPYAFSSSYEEESAFSDQAFKDILRRNHILGAFIDENSLLVNLSLM